jgi:SNF2 family DNA or RNA helicase
MTDKKVYNRDALNALLSVCDGASRRDFAGFNATDSGFARSLAHQEFWTGKQERALHFMLLKYARQIAALLGVEPADLAFETDEGRVREKGSAYAPTPQEPKEPEKPHLSVDAAILRLRSDYSFKDTAKSIPTRRWDANAKQWTYILNESTAQAFAKLIEDGIITASESVVNAIKSAAAEKERFEEGKHAVAAIKENGVQDIAVPLKATLYDHQKKAFAIATAIDNSALLMEQGTGKTFAAIAAAGKRFLDGQVRKLLVVAPNGILHVWKHEFEKFAAFPHRVVMLTGTTGKRKSSISQLGCADDILTVGIINYESAWRLVDEIKAWNPDMVICDESQKIKNGQTKQSKGLHEIGDAAKYRMILTGTPVTQSPLDFWSQYRFLDPRVFGQKFYPFRNRYAIMGGYQNKQVVGYQNEIELASKAHGIAYRVTKQECLDLPDEVDQIVYACLDPTAKKTYLEMEHKMFTEIEGKDVNASIVLTKLLKLQQITGGYVHSDDGTVVTVSSAKLDAFRDLVESYPNGKKLVVFANFRAEIEGIVNVVKDLKRSVAVFTGDTPMADREKINTDFQTQPDPEVLVLQAQTGGRGITLTAADTIIFYSLNFSLENYEQAKARIHRIGQTKKVTYVHLITKDTVDETVMYALKNKKSVADLVVDRLKHIDEMEFLQADAIKTAMKIFGYTPDDE